MFLSSYHILQISNRVNVDTELAGGFQIKRRRLTAYGMRFAAIITRFFLTSYLWSIMPSPARKPQPSAKAGAGEWIMPRFAKDPAASSLTLPQTKSCPTSRGKPP